MLNKQITNNNVVNCLVEKLIKFQRNDLDDLSDAALKTLQQTYGFTIGFHLDHNTTKEQLELYFKGVLIVPERILFVGKIDGVIGGSVQLIKPSFSNQTSSFAIGIDNHFVAPWARGYGLAKKLLIAAEKEAKELGFEILKLSVRNTSDAAINLYENLGYTKWGILDKYEKVEGKFIAGNFYYKIL